MRLFISIPFEGDFKDELIETIEDLKAESYDGKFTDEDNLHLTLAFLGETDKRDIPYIKDAMIRAVSNLDTTEPLELELGGIGSFSGREKGRTYYREIVRNKKLNWLAGRLQRELGIDEGRPFKPHITLARRCRVYDDFNKEGFESELYDCSMIVNKIVLFESTLTPSGPIYTPIYTLNID